MYILLLEQNNNQKEEPKNILLKIKFNDNNNKYKIKKIWISTIFAKKLDIKNQWPGFYYLIL